MSDYGCLIRSFLGKFMCGMTRGRLGSNVLTHSVAHLTCTFCCSACSIPYRDVKGNVFSLFGLEDREWAGGTTGPTHTDDRTFDIRIRRSCFGIIIQIHF